MRCKNCGGLPQHFLIANGGKNFYQCHTGLTTMRHDGSRSPRIRLCDTMHNERGEIVPAGTRLGFMSEGKPEIFTVGA